MGLVLEIPLTKRSLMFAFDYHATASRFRSEGLGPCFGSSIRDCGKPCCLEDMGEIFYKTAISEAKLKNEIRKDPH